MAMRWAVLLILSCLAAQAAEPVEVDGLWFLDEARSRNLGVKLYHPGEGAGPWPIVIVSHGLGGSQWGYGYLGRHLAAHGYVSIHCTHPGSDWLLWDGKGFSTAVGNLKQANADPANWRERPRDLSFLLGCLAEFERRVPALASRLDAGRIAVVGHSFGAYTALALAGLLPDLPEAGQLSDARPRAFVAMSPQGVGGFTPLGAWKDITRPVLLISGTDDDQPLSGRGKGLEWRMAAWEGLPAGEKFLLVLQGATHMTFAGGGMGEKADPRHLAEVNAAVTGFLDAELGGKPYEPQPVADGVWTAK